MSRARCASVSPTGTPRSLRPLEPRSVDPLHRGSQPRPALWFGAGGESLSRRVGGQRAREREPAQRLRSGSPSGQVESKLQTHPHLVAPWHLPLDRFAHCETAAAADVFADGGGLLAAQRVENRADEHEPQRPGAKSLGELQVELVFVVGLAAAARFEEVIAPRDLRVVTPVLGRCPGKGRRPEGVEGDGPVALDVEEAVQLDPVLR